ncbi:MAG: hypothetical protein IH933_08170 [Euryarchaeota archaeon]|jgi:hypothetical protein|nr:hypothetical protein [Euryarchaeota archaeon]
MIRPLTRRELLLVGTTTAGTAGCLSFDEGTISLFLLNTLEEDRDLSLMIARDGEVLLDEIYELEAHERRSKDNVIDGGEASVTARMVGFDREFETILTMNNCDEQRLVVEIQPMDQIRFRLSNC